VSKAAGIVALVLFFGLLFLLPIASEVLHHDSLTLAERFVRAGALVFGGGHVVLPLLQSAVVTPNWVSASDFLAGYGAAQAVPGPLFTFAAFLGAVSRIGPGGWIGGLLCLGAIFVPAALLIIGALPFWSELRERMALQSAMAGANAGVVGLLAAALYDPVWTTAVHSRADFALALIAFVGLVRFRASPLLVVTFAAIVGGLQGLMQ
jgi:chromate transporter